CLQQTRRDGDPDQGLYGESNPEFDGTFRQSLALLGLASADVTPDATAVQWLADQQCGSGGWPSYRADTSAPCAEEGSFLPNAPNTNSTGLAVQAFQALSATWDHDPVPYLQGAQRDDGGFGYDSHQDSATDANSTALSIQAIVALEQDPTTDPWQQDDGDTPLTALLALQLGCEAAGPDRGAFAYQPDDNGDLQANSLATYQGIWGAARAPLPLGTVELDSGDPFPDCPLEVVREAGETRIGTAIHIAGSSHPDGADTVVIAHAFGYADALAGAPLARLEDAPILLSDRDALPAEVADAVNELGATEAILLGGEAALSAQVADDLREKTGVETIDRIDGADRFDTAARIADRIGGEDVYVVEGADPDPTRGWPDALAVGSVAAHQQRPILLVTTDTLPDRTRAALEGKASATIVGGTAAVSADVAAAVDEEAGEVDRVAGADRYRTAAAVTEVARAAGMDPTTTWFATGRRFADALAAAPAVAKAGAVFMLVDGEDYANSPATDDYIHAVDHTLDVVVIVGGRLAITAGVQDAIETAAREDAL
ncbi:MAG: cell wall-binding repeat-containing protein, partial [Actinobacteria bacterium]|nr:cell wall-binding repeat-containing protein [Actinomycetota bacterium]